MLAKLLVVGGFQIGIECIGDVGALHLEQQLAFLHVVVEAGLDVDHAAIGQRDDGNFARDVGKDCAGCVQLGGGLDLPAAASGNLATSFVVDGDQVHVGDLDNLCRRRSAIALLLVFAAGESQKPTRPPEQEPAKLSGKRFQE